MVAASRWTGTCRREKAPTSQRTVAMMMVLVHRGMSDESTLLDAPLLPGKGMIRHQRDAETIPLPTANVEGTGMSLRRDERVTLLPGDLLVRQSDDKTIISVADETMTTMHRLHRDDAMMTTMPPDEIKNPTDVEVGTATMTVPPSDNVMITAAEMTTAVEGTMTGLSIDEMMTELRSDEMMIAVDGMMAELP